MDSAEPVSNELKGADIAQILTLLPHRYPFLMVDRIFDINGDDSCIGLKNITFNEPIFLGHFPGKPIFPGVLLIEGMAQTAGCICILKRAFGGPPPVVYFMSIDQCKFRKPVEPGDTVRYHMEKKRSRGNVWKYWGEARVGDTIVAEALVTAMIVPEE